MRAQDQLKLLSQQFVGNSWKVSDEELPTAEPWVFRIANRYQAKSPQAHKSAAVAWLFPLEEIGLDFHWVIPAMDTWFSDFGFGMEPLNGAVVNFESTRLASKSSSLKIATSGQGVRSALKARKVQNDYLDLFTTNLSQTWYEFKFWAPSDYRSVLQQHLRHLASYCGEACCFSSDQASLYFGFTQKGRLLATWNLGNLRELEDAHPPLDAVTFDLLLALSNSASFDIWSPLSQRYDQKAQAAACERLMQLPLDDVQRQLTPVLKLAARWFSLWYRDERGYSVLDESAIAKARLAIYLRELCLLPGLHGCLHALRRDDAAGWDRASWEAHRMPLLRLVEEAVGLTFARHPAIASPVPIAAW